MNQKKSGSTLIFNPNYILALISSVILCITISCHPNKNFTDVPNENDTAYKTPPFSWNVLFKPGTNKITREQFIGDIKDSIIQFYNTYNAINGTHFVVKTDTAISCTCDSLLYDYDFVVVNAAGPSASIPPPKSSGPRGSGDLIGAIVSDNLAITDPVKKIDTLQYKDSAVVRKIETESSKKLAIIDSGIDSSFFTPEINNLIWKDPLSTTLFNFLPGQPVNDLFDQTSEKHGTAVAAIIIKTMKNTKTYPKLMILKALDKNNSGTIFSVSCALSYAIQKKATLINLSLGYYGAPDSILLHYLQLCASATEPIGVFAAAGNTRGNHPGSLCNPNDSTLLSGSRLFYPACFSTDLTNITSVAQIAEKDSSCSYQNYSNMFISLGILNKRNCCAMQVDFLKKDPGFYEGSSFATPVASGLKMATILGTGNWNSLIQTDMGHKVTVNGKYIEYSPTSP